MNAGSSKRVSGNSDNRKSKPVLSFVEGSKIQNNWAGIVALVITF